VSSALPNVFRSSWMASACHAPVAAQHSPHAVLADEATRVAIVQWQCSQPAPLSEEELHATPQFQVSAR
jgi:hypothetical protein